MNQIRKKYKIVMVCITFFLALLIIFLLDYSYKRTSEVFTSQTEITVYDIKKEYLKENVLNVVGEMKVLEKEQKSKLLQSIYERMTLLENAYEENSSAFITEVEQDLLKGLDNNVTIYIEEMSEIVFTSDNNNSINITENEEAFSVYEKRKVGPYTIVMGVKSEDMANRVKESIRALIYEAEY